MSNPDVTSPPGEALDSPRAEPEDNLLPLVHRLSSGIGRVFGRRLRALHGITAPEWRTLMLLSERPECTAIDVANYYAMDKMAVTRAVQRLARAGYIERQRRTHDKRSFALRMTPPGHELYARLLPISVERYREFVGVLSEDERNQLRSLLSRLIERAEELDN